jgi:uncharacterized protein YndB with AHSA1/START domain
MHTIETTIEIAAPLATVHAAITTEAGYRGWWSEDSDYDGKRAEFRFVRKSDTMIATFRVERVDARGIAMTCVAEQNNPDWRGTTLDIALEPTATGTRVRLVHAGYPDNNECYAQCTKGWQFFLGSLDKYAATGTGSPHTKV